MINRKHSGMASIPCMALLAIITTPAAIAQEKPVLTFTFFGCNRVDAADVSPANPSTANVPQLKRNFADIAALKPKLAFFGGDLVMGYGNDKGDTLRRQMSAWIALEKSLPRATGCEYVAISGNHEKNRKDKDSKLPNPPTDGVWSKLVSEAGLVPKDAKGPTPSMDPADKLMADQQKLSFSFNRGPVHFVVLDTDTRVNVKDPDTGETKIGMIPVAWLDADLTRAEADPAVKCVVVMGHRNVIDPDSAKGDAPIDDEAAKPMIKSLKAHKKVRAYICAHVHAFDISEIGKNGLKQVCFGNGGSKLEKKWKPKEGRTFGFGYFKVYADGSLGVVPYLRPEPANYISEDAADVPPAKAQNELTIPVR
jgi:Calcineurin-like phosphoesterase